MRKRVPLFIEKALSCFGVKLKGEGLTLDMTLYSPSKLVEMENLIRTLRNRSNPYDYLIVETYHNPCGLHFIQTESNNETWRIEAGVMLPDETYHMFALENVSADRTVEIFRNVVTRLELPDLSEWVDYTNQVFPRRYFDWSVTSRNANLSECLRISDTEEYKNGYRLKSVAEYNKKLVLVFYRKNAETNDTEYIIRYKENNRILFTGTLGADEFMQAFVIDDELYCVTNGDECMIRNVTKDYEFSVGKFVNCITVTGRNNIAVGYGARHGECPESTVCLFKANGKKLFSAAYDGDCTAMTTDANGALFYAGRYKIVRMLGTEIIHVDPIFCEHIDQFCIRKDDKAMIVMINNSPFIAYADRNKTFRIEQLCKFSQFCFNNGDDIDYLSKHPDKPKVYMLPGKIYLMSENQVLCVCEIDEVL